MSETDQRQGGQGKETNKRQLKSYIKRESRLLEAELLSRIIPSRSYIPLAFMLILAILGMIGGYVMLTPIGILLGQQIFITSIGQQAAMTAVNASAAPMVGKTGAAAAASVPGSFAVYGMIAGGVSGALGGYLIGLNIEVESKFNKFRNLVMAAAMNKVVDEVEEDEE
ncbi:MAG: hypothetical protein [aquatic viral metagenome]